jgi:hypothetical protein
MNTNIKHSACPAPFPLPTTHCSLPTASCLLLTASCLLLTACSKGPTTTPAETEKPRVEEFSRGAVSVRFTFDPAVVRLDRDVLLTIRITAPTNVTVKLPPLETRVKGFTVAGSFDGHPVVSGGKAIVDRNIRLTPAISSAYRIAPMAVTWKQPGTGQEQWFPTKPVVLAAEPLVKGDVGKEIAPARSPVWIYPGLKGIMAYTLVALGIAALGYGAWRLFRQIRRAVRLRLMSPRERALFELAELMAKDLVGHNRVKDFYFALTMIVRLYIERAHSIRAPEQTTEEFLAAVSRDSRFSRDVVQRLRDFMQAADLVKYAGFKPDAASVGSALTTAKTYIETDETHSSTLKSRTP